MPEGFLERLKRCNSLDELGFERLVFYPGMLFGAEDKWWGDRGKRHRPHEGLDICLYRTVNNDVRQLGENTKIPALFAGEVNKVVNDYLGKSVFFSHNISSDSRKRHLYTIYGHTRPSENIRPGAKLGEGDIIGTIASAGKKDVMFHLHISVAWIPSSIRAEELDWKLIGDPVKASLIDPLEVITCPYSIIPQA